ncbi:hypothetical protein ACFL5O_04145 [Myxococcota bacterium]
MRTEDSLQAFLAAWLISTCLACPAYSSPSISSGGDGVSSEATAIDLSRLGRVKVGNKAHTQALQGGIRVWVAPRTELVIGPELETQLPGSEIARLYQFHLVTGALEITVAKWKGLGQSVLVRAADLVEIIPLDGRSEIVVSGQKAAVGNRDGKMLVGYGKKWTELASGASRTFTRASPGPETSVPTLPAIRLASRLALVSGTGLASNVVEWTESARAVAYRFELWREAASSRTRILQETITTTRRALAGLTPGRYWVSVVPLDSLGLERPAAPQQEFRVLGVKLPKGASMMQRSIYLLPHQRVRLLGRDGMFMTYGDRCTYFVPAPLDFGLGSVAETSVRFRSEGHREELRLMLRARHD